MSYKVLNDGRERSPVFFSDVSALAAQRFLDDRKAAELPLPTKDQVKRTERLLAGNPMLRRFRSPLGIQQLALELPMTRRERRARDLVLQPRTVRTNDRDEVTCPIENVQDFLDNHPGILLQDAVATIVASAGYSLGELPAVVSRVERWTNSNSARIPGHIRDKARMLDAIAKVSQLIVERDQTAAALEVQSEVQSDED